MYHTNDNSGTDADPYGERLLDDDSAGALAALVSQSPVVERDPAPDRDRPAAGDPGPGGPVSALDRPDAVGGSAGPPPPPPPQAGPLDRSPARSADPGPSPAPAPSPTPATPLGGDDTVFVQGSTYRPPARVPRPPPIRFEEPAGPEAARWHGLEAATGPPPEPSPQGQGWADPPAARDTGPIRPGPPPPAAAAHRWPVPGRPDESGSPEDLQWSRVVHDPGSSPQAPRSQQSSPLPPEPAAPSASDPGRSSVGRRPFLAEQADPGRSPMLDARLPDRSGVLTSSLLDATGQRWFWSAAAGVGVAAALLTGFVVLNLRDGGDRSGPATPLQADEGDEPVEADPGGPTLAGNGDGVTGSLDASSSTVSVTVSVERPATTPSVTVDTTTSTRPASSASSSSSTTGSSTTSTTAASSTSTTGGSTTVPSSSTTPTTGGSSSTSSTPDSSSTTTDPSSSTTDSATTTEGSTTTASTGSTTTG